MKGVLATWPIPGRPRETVDYAFTNTDRVGLLTMGANLATDDAIDNYIKAEVFATSGSVNYMFGTGSEGVEITGSQVFYGSAQCASALFKSTAGSEVKIFVEY